MAFSTIQGSGGAPDSFVGTSGVDSIAVVDSTGNYFLGAQQANDVISLVTTGNPLYSTVVNNTTQKGGQGNDSFTWTSAAATTYVTAFFNGNANDDTFTFAAADTFLSSTVQGGQGLDAIVGGTSTFSTSLINGNKNNDTLTFNGVLTTASLYGGQGNDTISGSTVANTNAVTNSVINGDTGNDTITFNSANKSLSGTTINGGEGNDTVTLTNSGIAATTVTVNGNAGADTITGTALGNALIFGGQGVDTITAGGAASTITGGEGADAITFAAAGSVERASYNGLGQGGAAGSATSTSNVAVGDTVGTFTTTEDFVNFASGSLVGTATSAALDGGVWDMNTNGVSINQTASGALANYAAAAVQIGNVAGDAGDVGYYIQEITAAAAGGANGVYNVYQVTLGTDKAAAGVALNAADTVALVAAVTTEAAAVNFATTNVSFLG